VRCIPTRDSRPSSVETSATASKVLSIRRANNFGQVDGSGTWYSLPFDLMPHKPNKFKNFKELSVNKKVIRTSPYVKPAFGCGTEASFIRSYLREVEFMQNHPDPRAQEQARFVIENFDGQDRTVKAAFKAKGLI